MGCCVGLLTGSNNYFVGDDYLVGKPFTFLPLHIRALRVFRENTKKKMTDTITLAEIEECLLRLNMAMTHKQLKLTVQRLDRNHDGALDVHEFIALFVEISKPNAIMEELFKNADQSNHGSLSAEDLHQFYKSNYPSHEVPTIERCNEIISRYEILVMETNAQIPRNRSGTVVVDNGPGTGHRRWLTSASIAPPHGQLSPGGNRSQPRLSKEGFFRLLTDPVENGIGDPMKLYSVYQDMKRPLSHYYINSSHNTYLAGHQLKGNASAAAVARALRLGVRVIELDCYNGADGNPLVTHGKTLVKPCTFKECVIAIRENAFVASEYPVILTIENHCDPIQQKRLGEILFECLGTWLYRDPEIMEKKKRLVEIQKKKTNGTLSYNAEAEKKAIDDLFVGPRAWLSPHDLKRKVIVRDKARRKKDKDKKQHKRNASKDISANGTGSETRSETHSIGSDAESAYDENVLSIRVAAMINNNESQSTSIQAILPTDSGNDLSYAQLDTPPSNGKGSAPVPSDKQSMGFDEEDEDGMIELKDILSSKPQIGHQTSTMDNLTLSTLKELSETDIGWLELLYIKNTKLIVTIKVAAPQQQQPQSQVYAPNSSSLSESTSASEGSFQGGDLSILRVPSLNDNPNPGNGSNTVNINGGGNPVRRVSAFFGTSGSPPNENGLSSQLVSRSSIASASDDAANALALAVAANNDPSMPNPSTTPSNPGPTPTQLKAAKKKSFTFGSQSANNGNNGEPSKMEYITIHEYPYCSSSSISEKKMVKLCKPGPRCAAMATYTRTHIVRSYPDGTRVTSSNYLPHIAWNSGIQVAALNYQTNGLPVWLSQGKFSDNGGSGYVLKPVGMMKSPPYVPDPSAQPRKGAPLWDLRPRFDEKVMDLRITLISGHLLPKNKNHQYSTSRRDSGMAIGFGKMESVDPFVELHIFGAPQDTTDHEKYQMSMSAFLASNNGNPNGTERDGVMRRPSRGMPIQRMNSNNASMEKSSESTLTVSAHVNGNGQSIPVPDFLGDRKASMANKMPERKKSTGRGSFGGRGSIGGEGGGGISTLRHKRSMVVKENGVDPCWNEVFEFTVEYPELAILAFVCKDADPSGNGEEFIGQAVIPLSMVRSGYRVVPLRTMDCTPVEGAFLFVNIELDFPALPNSKIFR